MDFFMTVVAERSRHFIHRTKEEMVRFDGRPLYPQRHCDTLSYALRPAEQELYDATTRYIAETYNKARILNRSAARLAMSVFQRRLASSTYALMRSCVPAGPTSWSGIRRASPTRPISSSPEPPTKTPATEANGKVMKRSRRPPRSCTHKGKRDSLFGSDVIQASKQREIEDAGTARSDGCGMGDHLAVVA